MEKGRTFCCEILKNNETPKITICNLDDFKIKSSSPRYKKFYFIRHDIRMSCNENIIGFVFVLEKDYEDFIDDIKIKRLEWLDDLVIEDFIK